MNAKRPNYYDDKEYARYIHSGEALAIAVIKGSSRCSWTKGFWLDIVDMETFERSVPTVRQPRYYDDRKYKTAFNWVVAEQFPRKTNPEYVKGDEDTNRYLTWKAAHEDIQAGRKAGYRGKLHLVLISLVDENRGAKCKVRYLQPHKSERDGRWVDANGYLKGPLSDPKPKPIKVVEGPDPKWVYTVAEQAEITSGHLKAIQKKRYEIVEAIRADRGAKLSHFPPEPQQTHPKRKTAKSSGNKSRER